MAKVDELKARVEELEGALKRANTLEEISRGLSAAHTEQEILEVLAQPGIEQGISKAELFYLELDDEGRPEWLESVGQWLREDAKIQSYPVGSRFNLVDFPLSKVMFSSPNEPLLIADVQEDERVDEGVRQAMTYTGNRALLIIPLVQADRWVGLLNFSWDAPHHAEEEELSLYQSISDIGAPTMESRRLLTEKQRAVVESLYEISRDLNRAGSEDEMLRAMTRIAWEEGASVTSLIYVDLDENGDPEWLEIVATRHREDVGAYPVGTRFYVPEFPFMSLWLADSEEPLLLADVKTDERLEEKTRALLLSSGDTRALVTIPLAQSGRWGGIVTMSWAEPHHFNLQEEAIYRALTGLATPVIENRRLLSSLEAQASAGVTRQQLAEEALRDSERQLRTTINAMLDSLYVIDSDYQIVLHNDAMSRELERVGLDGDILGKTVFEAIPALEEYREDYEKIFETGKPMETERRMEIGDRMIYTESRYLPVIEEGQVAQIITIVRDVTEQKEAEIEHQKLQEEIIEAQQLALQELSVPIIPVMDQIIVMPLIGGIDTMRAKDVMRTLLQGIGDYRAKVVIVDMTGVPLVDSGVASHLNKTIQAARLKGARTIITGLSDAVAETIIDLGIDWEEVETLRDLQTGLMIALERLGYRLTR